MAMSLLKDIISVEQIADQKEQDAQKKAREIIASAKKEASAILEEKEREAELEAREIVKSYEQKALKDIESLRNKIQEECQNIRRTADKKIEEAANFIVGRIVTRSDR